MYISALFTIGRILFWRVTLVLRYFLFQGFYPSFVRFDYKFKFPNVF